MEGGTCSSTLLGCPCCPSCPCCPTVAITSELPDMFHLAQTTSPGGNIDTGNSADGFIRWVYYSGDDFCEMFQKPKSRILPLPPPPLSPTPPPPTTRMFIWQVARATVLRVEVLVITSFDTYFFEFLFAFCLLVCLLFMLILFAFLFFSFCFAGNA